MWVRSEYAGALSVLFTWASAVIPWSVSMQGQEAFTFVVIRFPLFAFQFLYGIVIRGGEVPFLLVYDAPAFSQSAAVSNAYRVWLAGAAIYVVALAVSVGYYAREDRVESAMRARLGDPVRVLGVLVAVSGIVLGASTVMLWQSLAGLTIPLGWLFMIGFGAVLLRVDRADPDAGTAS